jgi:hypothetical protein
VNPTNKLPTESDQRKPRRSPNVDDAVLADPQAGDLSVALRPGYERYQAAERSEGLPTEPNESVPVRNTPFAGSGMRGRAPGLK